MFFNSDFYPTPDGLASRMINMIKGYPRVILEPSGGKGDLIDAINTRFHRYNYEIYSIEIEEQFHPILRSKKAIMLDYDFLEYSGPDKFDLIIANPPFSNGEKHLLKAIDIMYNGQIIFLLNAETLKNPYSNSRKLLVDKLEELNAEIEYVTGAFQNAERKTNVEVAIVNIIIERNVETDLFSALNDDVKESTHKHEENYEVSTGRDIEEIVADYNVTVQKATETILSYFQNYRKIGKYIFLNSDHNNVNSNLTTTIQTTINTTLTKIRKDYWTNVLNIKDISSRLTKKKRNEFDEMLKDRCLLDFTESNIRQLIINLIGSYDKTITDCVLEVFDKFTVQYKWDNHEREKNILHFNGWKTNDAYKANKKVIIPIRVGYGTAFLDWAGNWDLDYQAVHELNDIDKVMSYLDGMRKDYIKISDAMVDSFELGVNTKIKSTYFTVTCYKKGTIHLTFNDMDILRRFNLVACKGKGWLPGDYGKKSYNDMQQDEKNVVNAFEGKKSYQEKLNQPLFGPANNLLQIDNI